MTKAMELLVREDLNHVPVVADRHFEGMISRANILQVLESHVELRKAA